MARDLARTQGAHTIPPADLDALRAAYTFRDEAEVLAFLEEHPFLVPLLREAPPQIRRHFPPSPLVLEVRVDPEEGDEALALYVRTGLEPEDALDRLNQVAEDWWLDEMHKSNNRLFLNLEFQ